VPRISVILLFDPLATSPEPIFAAEGLRGVDQFSTPIGTQMDHFCTPMNKNPG
jgi:hypothetical protein